MQVNFPSINIIRAAEGLATDKVQFPRHRHQFCEVAFITRGYGYFSINETSIAVERGSIIFCPPNRYHYFYSRIGSNMEYSVISFVPEAASFLSEELARNTASVSFAEQSMDYVDQTFQTIISLWSARDDACKAAAAAFCVSLLLLVQAAFAQKSLPVLAHGDADISGLTAHQIYHYITDHNAEKLTLSSIARHFNISPSSLSHSFADTFGISPIEHMLRSRLADSAQYLTRTDMTVDEVARKVGYSTTSLFIRQFRARIGCKPTEYRQERKKHVAQFETSFHPEFYGMAYK